ncbi:MAG: 4Fe-4S dicluster domain-containing protein [Actinobacteria bacterium]|nr:MAG: 4Fe-4S dicluster domain-containing protein [Actinomycetota bacterium]
MSELRYIEDVVTLGFDAEKCTGCRQCAMVCPHGVFEMADGRARVVDRGACMECGACLRNCRFGAITLEPGVGCAAAIINGWIHGTEPSCDCG